METMTMSHDDFLEYMSTPENMFFLWLFKAHQVELYAFFGQHEKGTEFALDMGDGWHWQPFRFWWPLQRQALQHRRCNRSYNTIRHTCDPEGGSSSSLLARSTH
jgi:hypothetical protein